MSEVALKVDLPFGLSEDEAKLLLAVKTFEAGRAISRPGGEDCRSGEESLHEAIGALWGPDLRLPPQKSCALRLALERTA